ncbi:hypothetical protein EDC18_101478 [Natranaerovirga pectinivora]|uniref:Uncharacterized protein n=1 Tax=Natranaerovirga pectinivora TaxID=682400 RepID=A0A4R3MTY3_9FIRM|nr:DUF6054 family protein [Natranaerovirga pectinivora]TCT17180.1 hypothetical protein EDC18_101478 [Natranaerovirga pectinivora]
MSSYNFKVKQTPLEALNFLKEGMDYDLIHEKVHTLDNGMYSIIVVYEKYFMRNSSRAALTVTINNFYGDTEIESVSAGASQGMFFRIDWGANDEFANSVKYLFREHIIN